MDNKKFCKFCGEEIDKEAIVCPKCGRQLKLISKEELKKEDYKQEEPLLKEEQSEFYTQSWCMWIMMFIFTPIGIFLMWKFHPEINKNTKIVITVIIGILVLFAVLFGEIEDETTNNAKSKIGNEKNRIKIINLS